MRLVMILAATAALSACGAEEGAGGLTADESRQLNEAAAMLDIEPGVSPPPAESASDTPDR